MDIMCYEQQVLRVKREIEAKTKDAIDKNQREYFLREELKVIQEELGDKDGIGADAAEFRRRLEEKNPPEEVRKTVEKEIDRMMKIPVTSPESNVSRSYIDTLLNLPWNEMTEETFDLKQAAEILDEDHYGLEKVKERILEHLAVLKLKGDMKSPIICLYGPPGVGKTSLGKSIASALKRKYVRMSLGGVHDEAEIRGHRKTYIGAMPGRIIKSLIKAGASNPVFILDEIDKVSADRQGDPSSALLEVLDPEQNTSFHDNFLDVDYDLSKVLFIATANNLNTIPGPLLDRMELIEVSGYITEEKVEIARKHLLPKELEANGLKKTDIKLPKDTLEAIIESYTCLLYTSDAADE